MIGRQIAGGVCGSARFYRDHRLHLIGQEEKYPPSRKSPTSKRHPLNPSPIDSESPQITFREKLQREGERCERAILRRLYTAPARIEDLDALGFPKTLINRILHSLLHQDRVTFHGFTYFYHHLRSITEKIS